jgi:hypothetical protein
MSTEPRRIALHDHADGNSGGPLDAARVNSLIDNSSTTTTGGTFSGAASDITVLDAGGYFTGTDVEAVLQELAAKDIGYDPHGAMGATETFSALIGWHSRTFSADCTFSFTGATAGLVASMVLELLEDGTGGWQPTWPGSVVWPGGVAPTHDDTAGTTTIYLFQSRDGGTTWYGFQAGGSGVTFGTPAIVLGTAAAAGAIDEAIRRDATIVAFDATVPTTQALGDAAATGSAAVAARRDHNHAMPALSTATPLVESGAGATGTGTASSREDHVHPAAASTAFIVIGQEERIADGSTVAWTLDNDFEEYSVSARNLTTGHNLSVTETSPNTATISAAGTAGDIIAFGYAASVV